jgi:long-chain acyl-CoA synthetase
MNVALWLERTATNAGANPALFSDQKMVGDYATFFRQAATLATSLRSMGVEPGDRVALFMKNCPQYLIVLHAAWIAGAAVVPINAKLHPKEAAWIVENSCAKLVFVTTDLGVGLGETIGLEAVDVQDGSFPRLLETTPMPVTSLPADALAWLFYTSGTTGRPKGVEITHAMLAAMSLSYLADVDNVAESTSYCYSAPMSHGAGLYAPVHVLRAARHLCLTGANFDAGEVLDISAACGSASMFLAPTMVRRLIDAAKARGSRGEGIDTIVYGGGPMYRADIEEAVDWFGPKFVQIYGQGECPMSITALSRADICDRSHPRWRERLNSVGKAQSVVEVTIGDGEGNRLPPGSIGEIMVRGLPVMCGYWNNPEATAKTIRDGWLMTGDIGVLDADGYLTLQDRSKDVIISGGTNIYPREVEEVLLTHPSVTEVSVIGAPSMEWGEDIVAFVVLAPGCQLDPAALSEHCVNEIARFKKPKFYHAVEELPKNNYGKVLKTELRETARMLAACGER